MDVAEAYATWPDKGPLLHGRRLTILAPSTRLRPGETLTVAHVHEVVRTGEELYVMGPKPVYGEELDGRLVTPPVPLGDHPLVPGTYDGVVLDSPAVDVNFEPTEYRFDGPGRHELRWQVDDLVSNTLAVEVVAP